MVDRWVFILGVTAFTLGEFYLYFASFRLFYRHIYQRKLARKNESAALLLSRTAER